ncbi:hypothetical protein ACFV8E_09870 [Streptomyces sp. NPDC059849]|uniref:hypothetical protein n=1 Tax=Streptomyces sp. NPDC059849 TaxID=3346969 RepID=UPI00365B0A34
MVTVEGKLDGVKTLDDVMMLCFRESVLPRAGITPPDSFDVLADAANALSSKKTKGLFAGQDGLGDSTTLPAFSTGGDLATENGEAGFGSFRAAEAVAGLKRLHDDRSLLLGFTTDWWDPAATAEKLAQRPAKKTAEPAANPLPPDLVAVVRNDGSPRSARSPSSTAGSPSCGRWSSARTRPRGRPRSPVDVPHLPDHQPPGLSAGAVVTTAPPVAMFPVAQRYIVEAITTSGLKG